MIRAKRCPALLALGTAATLGLAASANADVYVKVIDPQSSFYDQEISGLRDALNKSGMAGGIVTEA